MSLINKMLQDLDKRNAMQDNPDAKNLRRQVRAVGDKLGSSGIGSEWFWRVLAGLMLVALGWVGWVLWQLSPHPVVNEAALRAVPPRPAAQVQVPPLPPISMPLPATDTNSVTDAQGSAANSGTAGSVPNTAPNAPAETGGLKFATELSGRSGSQAQPGTGATPSNATASTAGVEKKAPKAPAATPAAINKVDRQESAAARVQAEADYRRGAALVNQGRIAEGMDALRAALGHDAGLEAARQTMIALLLEAKRLDEAARLLREGLALNPSHAGFATLLARVTVETGDAAGALAILDRAGASANATADQRAFRAALLQRLGRHKEAVEEYRVSLSATPGTAQWWVGLGISQQALAQPREALESYRRARSAGVLTPELASFVDQRIRQLQ